MSFKKPFRAAPVRLGPYAQAQQRRAQRATTRSSVLQVVGAALMAGLAIGAVWTAGTNRSQAYVRASAPPAGAYYPGCNAARAAGVAPIYEGEPGYRPELDGDSDGIACEPLHSF
jgi:hypothetical protein